MLADIFPPHQRSSTMRKLKSDPISPFLLDSAGIIEWVGHAWLTIRHALIAAQFVNYPEVLSHLAAARSPEMAEEIATGYERLMLPVGDDVTKEIFRAKLAQHPCVRRQLLSLCEEEAVRKTWLSESFHLMDMRYWSIWLELRDELVECRNNQEMVLHAA